MTLLHILEVMFGFCFMVAIHEWGHFIAMRLLGVGVEEYCLFFPPRIASKKFGNTLYSIGAIPLGGFCKPQGGDLSGQSAEEINSHAPQPGDYMAAAWWRRILILLAGPMMNFISAFVIVTLVYMALGEPYFDQKPLLGFVPPASLAAQAGLQKGDMVLKVDGKDIATFEDLEGDLPGYGKSCLLTVQRGNKTFDAKFAIPPKSADPKATEPEVGINDTTPAVVGEAIVGQPARNAGVQDGDQVLAVNGQKPADWGELSFMIRNAAKDPLQMEIQRGDKTYNLSIHRVFTGDYMAVGIGKKMEDEKYKRVSVVEAVKDGVDFTSMQCLAMMKGIGNLVLAKTSLKDSVAGPITIMRMMYNRATEKIEDFLALVSSISLMLFLMNLLPIPLVDGGQIVLCLIEGVKRNPVSLRLQMVYQQVGFFLIIALFALAFFNDFKNIFLEIHNHLH